MAYNKFTLTEVKEQFNLTIDYNLALFRSVPAREVEGHLVTLLEKYIPLAVAISTEKSRSEWIIAPILAELHERLHGKMSLFSGIAFNVARKQKLVGVCDFLISRSPDQLSLTAPVIAIAEAKKADLMGGLGQCVATMIAARLFNEKKQLALPLIYGIVTTGTEWKFLQLEGQTVYVDMDEYYINDLGKIMGILTHMVLN